MNVYDFAAARAKRPTARRTPENDKASFGKVYEIETARRARGARIPLDVVEEMEAAAGSTRSSTSEGRAGALHPAGRARRRQPAATSTATSCARSR